MHRTAFLRIVRLILITSAALLIACAFTACIEVEDDPQDLPLPGDDDDDTTPQRAWIEYAFFTPPSIPSEQSDVTFTAQIGYTRPDALASCTVDLTALGNHIVDLLRDAEAMDLGSGLRLEYSFSTHPQTGSIPRAELNIEDTEGNRETAEVAFLNGFLWGMVFAPGQRDLTLQCSDMSDLGVHLAKFWLPWSEVQPRVLYYNPQSKEISCEPQQGFRLLERRDFTDDPDLIQEAAFPEQGGRFAAFIDWTSTDRLIYEIASNGIDPLPLIADATTAPYLVLDQYSALRIAPEIPEWSYVDCSSGACTGYAGIGRQPYLDAVFLHAASAARRYGSGVPLWNTENELNWAYAHVLFAGWRKGDAWLDSVFCTDLLQTLHSGIRAGNPYALTTMNFNIHDPLFAVRLQQWQNQMDIVGLGAYPNYLFGKPLLYDLLTAAVGLAKDMAYPKPVMVLETGYPTGPPQKGYNVELQKQYIINASAGTVDNGATGYVLFKLDDVPDPPPWYELQAVEYYWGLVDAAGVPKQSFYTYQQIVSGSP